MHRFHETDFLFDPQMQFSDLSDFSCWSIKIKYPVSFLLTNTTKSLPINTFIQKNSAENASSFQPLKFFGLY